MFMLGAYVSTNQALQHKILSINPLIYLVLYAASYAAAAYFGIGTGNGINVVSYMLLSALIFSLAHYKPGLSNSLLQGNDISYGVYIYHMPIVNLFLYLGILGSAWHFAGALALTFAVSLLSWFCIEKPALKLKKMALRNYN
ncbi:acyltransferase family protein [Sphingomonas soli]|uniref:acyltransferase family protein n=1 Tax=Sphingomonas soli TaxID=266127 RepID=UPI00083552EB|nr:hypothetical protein [Sphingomonas soli]